MGDRADRANSFNTTCDHPTKMHKINTDTDIKDKERDILAIVRLATFETLFTLLIIENNNFSIHSNPKTFNKKQ